MNLDLPTLMAMESFVAICAGAVLLIAWWGNSNTAALGLWGLADSFAAGGIFCLLLSGALHQSYFSLIGGALLVLAQGLTWKAARTFDAKPAPLGYALTGVLILGIAGAVPGIKEYIGTLGLTLSSGYLFAAAFSLWPSREARLPARLPIIVFTAVHSAVLMLGAFGTIFGSVEQSQIPSLLGPFGLIHFESIIFVVGTAVFQLAMVKERSEAASRIAAGIDSLTGIANRAAFMTDAEKMVERCGREGVPVSVIMFDLDRFKTVNDTFGHATGDDVIRKFCQITAAALRPTDIFGRIGGEEFAVAMPRSGIEVAFVRADRIRAAFAEECRVVNDHHVNATASGGVSVSTETATSLSMLLKCSDDALYRAKAAGRNRIKRAEQLALGSGTSDVIRVA